MAIVEHSVDGLLELTQVVLDIADPLSTDQFLWFRGVNCYGYPLHPKIMRDRKTSEEVFEREARLLTRFRQRSMAYWPAGYPQNNWEHLFAMQHYGIPTRLLDWSENLYVAAHFASLGNPTHAEPHEGECNPVIWCVDPIAWNRSTPSLSDTETAIYVLTTSDEELGAYETIKSHHLARRKKSPVMMFGAHNSDRIVAQRGTFMIWGTDTRSLQEIAREQAAPLHKIEITGGRERLATQLRQLGFSETMVFPELTYLSAELARSEGWK